MAEERKPGTHKADTVDHTNTEQPVNPVEEQEQVDQATDSKKKQAEQPAQNRPEEENKQKPQAEKGEKKSFWQMIKDFFKSVGDVLKTPSLLFQKFMLRLVGGKEAVKAAEQAGADAIKEAQVKEATQRARDFTEREVNKILDERMQTQEWTNGLHIASVKFMDNETGQDAVSYSIVVQCEENQQFGGEYHIHMGADGQLLRNAQVPDEIFMQLSELMREVQLHSGDVQISANDDIDMDADVIDENQPPENPFEVINCHNGKEVTVTRDPNAPQATITVIEGQSERTYTAQYTGGHIRIEGMAQGDSASALVAQTVYQAFKPVIDSDIAALAANGQELYPIAATEAFRDMRDTAHGVLSTPVEELSKTSTMFIIPAEQGSVSVVRANVTPQNVTERGNNDLIHMHTFRLDTKDGQNFTFDTVQQGKKEETKLADVSLYTSMATKPNALNAAMMQVQYASTHYSALDSHQTPEGQTIQLVAFADDAKFAATGNVNLIACAQVVPQHEGFELQTERVLSNAELQGIMAYVPQNDNTTFSPETYADAVDVLKQSAGVRGDDQAYSRYFVMGDTAFAYDGQHLTVQRAGDAKPFVKDVKELDSEAIQEAYADYAKAIADAERDTPVEDEHEVGDE